MLASKGACRDCREGFMSKRIAIIQSSYIPWRGYFDIIGSVDEFILFDDVQFTRRDWRNRNRIKTPTGTQWLTIPVATKDKYSQRICDTEIADRSWTRKHWSALRHSYARAPAFKVFADRIGDLYEKASGEGMLSSVNRLFLQEICSILDIGTPFGWSPDYPGTGTKTARLIEICEAVGADSYLSGPSAAAYIEPELFAAHGIKLDYMDYSGYPPYPQLHGEFDPYVSILDLLFHQGADARRLMKPVR